MPITITSPRIQFQLFTDLFGNITNIVSNQILLNKQIETLPPNLKTKTVEDLLKSISSQLVILNKNVQSILPMCQPTNLPPDVNEKLELLLRMAYVSSEHAFSNR